MELSNSYMKKIFIFQKTEILKKFLKFSYIYGTKNLKKIPYISENFSYISGNGNPKNILYYRRELSNSKNEKDLLLECFLYYGKWNVLTKNLKTPYISERNLQGLKIKNFLHYVSNIRAKEK